LEADLPNEGFDDEAEVSDVPRQAWSAQQSQASSAQQEPESSVAHQIPWQASDAEAIEQDSWKTKSTFFVFKAQGTDFVPRQDSSSKSESPEGTTLQASKFSLMPIGHTWVHCVN
jgi:hypothetical protein